MSGDYSRISSDNLSPEPVRAHAEPQGAEATPQEQRTISGAFGSLRLKFSGTIGSIRRPLERMMTDSTPAKRRLPALQTLVNLVKSLKKGKQQSLRAPSFKPTKATTAVGAEIQSKGPQLATAFRAAHNHYCRKHQKLRAGDEFSVKAGGQQINVKVMANARLEVTVEGKTYTTCRMPDGSCIIRGEELGKGAVKRAYSAVRLSEDGNSLTEDCVEVVPLFENNADRGPDSGLGQIEEELGFVEDLPKDKSSHFAVQQEPIRSPSGEFVGYVDVLYEPLEKQTAGGDEAKLIQFAGYYRGAADALSALHDDDKVFSDFKPANLYAKDGQGFVADFGTVCSAKETGKQCQMSIQYMAPEGIQKDRDSSTAATDCWAFGVSLWQQCYGEWKEMAPGFSAMTFPPFIEGLLDANKLVEKLPEMTDEQIDQKLFPTDNPSPVERVIRNVILGCLTVNPDQRMTMEQARDLLGQIQ